MPQPWTKDSCTNAAVCGMTFGWVLWSTAPIRRLCPPCHVGIVGPLPVEIREKLEGSL